MQFLKKHFEKVILSVVLLGLALAAAALPLEVNHVSQFLEETRNKVVRTTAKPFKPVDLSTNTAVVKRFEGRIHFGYSEPHNVFNPVLWLKRPDGSIFKSGMGNSGPVALVVTNIEELNLIVSFDGMGGAGDKPQYQFTVINETNSTPRRKQLATPGLKNQLFDLIEVKGPPQAPTAFVIKLNSKDEKQTLTVTKDKPYNRIIGYSADLIYPPGNQTLTKRRKDQPIHLKDDTETYKIVAINRNEVVLSADSTKKRTTLKWNSTP